jgi:transcriptional regulator with XRE-family HTH domain
MLRRKRSSISPQDREIAIRLRQIRRARRITQSRLAGKMALSREQVASVESLRVPLRFWPALKACNFLRVNVRWLAEGEGREWQSFIFEVNPGTSEKISERTSLSAGFAMIREKYVALEQIFPAPSAEEYKAWLDKNLGVEQTLDNPMQRQSLWNQLKARLAEAAKGRGVKAALARELGVTNQAVSEWLSGASAPKASTTLWLLNWVIAAEEANQKKRASQVAAQPALNTRAKKSKHENSDQKKK